MERCLLSFALMNKTQKESAFGRLLASVRNLISPPRVRYVRR